MVSATCSGRIQIVSEWEVPGVAVLYPANPSGSSGRNGCSLLRGYCFRLKEHNFLRLISHIVSALFRAIKGTEGFVYASLEELLV